MRVLVVDDDPLAAAMTAAILEESEHETMVAENAVEAMEMLGETHPDLIIADLNMPLVSGIDLFKELNAQGLNIPFVLLTGDDPATLSDRTMGMTACLMKDETLEEKLPRLLIGLIS